MSIQFSDYPFVPCESAVGGPRGDGSVLVPLSAVSVGDAPPSVVSVVDHDGRSVTYEGGGRVYFTDSDAGTRDFVGWSYWEEDATCVPCVTPVVNFLVLSPDYDAGNFPLG